MTEPVEMMKVAPVMFDAEPSSPWMASVWAFVNFPQPRMSANLPFFSSASRYEANSAMSRRLRAWIAAMSTRTGVASRPNWDARPISCQRWADSSSDFDGMQPRRMQSPAISLPPSTTATRAPSAAAVRAAAYPALPPPTTTTS
jgi:hypothetical protein